MRLERWSHGRTIKLEVTRLEILINLPGVVLLGNLLQLGLVSSAISSDSILEHAGVVHIDIFIEDADVLSLSNYLLHELVDERVDSLVVRLVLPPAGDVQKVNRARGTGESERVATVVFHVVQHGLGDALIDEDGLGTRNIAHLRNHRVEEIHHPVSEFLVKSRADGPIHLAKAVWVLGLEVLDVLNKGLGTGIVGNSRNVSVLLEDFRVWVVLDVGQFGGGKVHSLGLKKGDILLGIAVNGGIIDHVGPSVNNLGKFGLEEGPSTAIHLWGGDCEHIVLGDKTKVVATTAESPV